MAERGLSAPARKLLAALQGAGQDRGYGDVKVTSGYRSVLDNLRAGGARDSQHIHGNAIDLSIADLNEAQRAALLEVAIANGARGVGIYPDGRRLHLDTRDEPMFWGTVPGKPYAGADYNTAPSWALSALTQLFNPALGAPEKEPMLADVLSSGGGGAPLDIRASAAGKPQPPAVPPPFRLALGAGRAGQDLGELEEDPSKSLAALLTAGLGVAAAAGSGPTNKPARPNVIRQPIVAPGINLNVETPKDYLARMGL